MKKVISYNFDGNVLEKTNWRDFYMNRRDANFAAVFETGQDEYIAIRDHLGTCPIYYRNEGGVKSAGLSRTPTY